MTERDVMQAIRAALQFGIDAGYAARDGLHILHLGGGVEVVVSEDARALLRAAMNMGIPEPTRPYPGVARYDLEH